MMKLKVNAKRVVAIADKLRKNFIASEIKLKNKNKDRLPVDLTDVYTICVECKFLIEELLKVENWTNTESLRKIVQGIEDQLYTHLPYHYKPLQKRLGKISEQITTEEDIDWDLEEIFAAVDELRNASEKKSNKKSKCQA